MTIDPTTLTIDPTALRALLEAAKGRPWFFAYNRIVSQPVSREYDRIERTIPATADDNDPLWATLPEPDVCVVDTSHGDTASRQGAADADLIVAAVNALPGLLDVLEAAVAWRDSDECDDFLPYTRRQEELVAAIDRARAKP